MKHGRQCRLTGAQVKRALTLPEVLVAEMLEEMVILSPAEFDNQMSHVGRPSVGSGQCVQVVISSLLCMYLSSGCQSVCAAFSDLLKSVPA